MATRGASAGDVELGSLVHTQFDDADAFVYGEEEPYDAGYDSHEGKVTLARHSAADDATGWDFFQLVLVKLLDNAVVTVIMAIATFFALFGDDFRLAALPKEADAAFTALSTITLILFALELVLSCLAKTHIADPPSEADKQAWANDLKYDDRDWQEKFFRLKGYFLSFFFFLDLVATLSLLPDIDFMWGPLAGTPSETTTLAEGEKASGRADLDQVFRMVRLVRLVKLYIISKKVYMRWKGKRATEDEDSGAGDGEHEQHESKVGSQLSTRTTNKVIVVVLLMLIVVPIFSYSTNDLTEEFSTDVVHAFNVWHQGINHTGWEQGPRSLVATLDRWDGADSDARLVKFQLTPDPGLAELSMDRPDVYNDLRTGLAGDELKKVYYEETVTVEGNTIVVKTEAWYNQKPISVETALFGIGLTVFVTFLLALGWWMFGNDARRLVLDPIEHMVAIVKAMARQPIKDTLTSDDNKGKHETSLLENTIKKIGGLLRVGFGQAGANIIANNLASGSDFNPMVAGQVRYAIFGFIYLLNFDDMTETLEEDVLLFINKISKVVHDVSMSWGGQPNKNMGEAYLITWLLDADERDASGRPIKQPLDVRVQEAKRRADSERAFVSSRVAELRRAGLTPSEQQQDYFKLMSKVVTFPKATQLADRALIACLKILGEISRSRDIIESAEHRKMTEKMDGYFVRMKFGLHAGWAIEGAIGSIHKVDASYLSPHVNIASRMCSAAKQYGVPILFSEPLHNCLSDCAKKYCRMLDVIMVKGSKVPLPVYTYDVWEWKHSEENQLVDFSTFIENCTNVDVFNKSQEIIKPHERRISVLGPATIIEHTVKIKPYKPTLFDEDQELMALRMRFTENFRRRFERGVKAYINGDWPKARALLENTLQDASLPREAGDGPSRTLLQYMSDLKFQAPEDWQGNRALTSK